MELFAIILILLIFIILINLYFQDARKDSGFTLVMKESPEDVVRVPLYQAVAATSRTNKTQCSAHDMSATDFLFK